MDREHVKSAADKMKGAVKEDEGKLIGDKKLQTEGRLEKAKSTAHTTVSDAKGALKNARNK